MREITLFRFSICYQIMSYALLWCSLNFLRKIVNSSNFIGMLTKLLNFLLFFFRIIFFFKLIVRFREKWEIDLIHGVL